ncbi:MAG TPA: hypothetical protein VFV17_05985 [Usitatibacteraceae bacterium]|nr:hypothetical protein [Usitatibacteraceae bacterium]
MHLESSEQAGAVSGEVFAEVGRSYARTSAAMHKAAQWCDILMLHLNTKACRADNAPGATLVHLAVGRKFDQPLAQAYRISLRYHVVAMTDEYLRIEMLAANGPLGTSDFRIGLEVVASDATHSLIHLTYSYSVGLIGRSAMAAYLATAGRSKVGFTIDGYDADRTPRYIGGMRGVVERNTMRYYLAVEALLESLDAPPAERAEKRLRSWFASIERFPRQLHEMELDEYLAMKRGEMAR